MWKEKEKENRRKCRERKSKYKYYTVIPEFFDLTRFLNSTFFIFGASVSISRVSFATIQT